MLPRSSVPGRLDSPRVIVIRAIGAAGTGIVSDVGSGVDNLTETLSVVRALGANGTIASGLNLDTLTSWGSSSYTYSESGGRTITFGEGGYIGGSYSGTEATQQSYTLSPPAPSGDASQAHRTT